MADCVNAFGTAANAAGDVLIDWECEPERAAATWRCLALLENALDKGGKFPAVEHHLIVTARDEIRSAMLFGGCPESKMPFFALTCMDRLEREKRQPREVKGRQIGSVAVDSGQITIGDPQYVGQSPEFCVTFSRGGDGRYPVFELDIDDRKYVAVELIHDHCELAVH